MINQHAWKGKYKAEAQSGPESLSLNGIKEQTQAAVF